MPLMRRNYGKEYFDSIFFREKRHSPRNYKRLSLLPPVPSGGKLLEIGCGSGGFSEVASQRYQVECMDVSDYAVEKVRRSGIEAVVGDVQQAVLPAGSFTAVAAFNVLEHLPQPAAALARLFTSLQPGGFLVGSVPNNGGLAGRSATFVMNTFDRTHVFTPPPAVWDRLLLEAGFDNVTLLGELNLGPSLCVLIRGPLWRQLAFNLMFVAHKPAA